MRVAIALVVPLALVSGCAGAGEGFGFARSPQPIEPYFQEYRATMAGEHHQRYEIPVDAQARLLNVTILLDARTQGLPLPDMPLARLDARLLDSAGNVLAEARVDPREPEAALVAQDIAPGTYGVELDGFGASQEVDGREYGAAYVLTIEVLYTE